MEAIRSCRLIRDPGKFGRWGCFRIREGDKVWYYLFREIKCDIGGRGFEIRKLASGSSYHARIGHTGNQIGCDCIGYESRGLCRHILALNVLMPRIYEVNNE